MSECKHCGSHLTELDKFNASGYCTGSGGAIEYHFGVHAKCKEAYDLSLQIKSLQAENERLKESYESLLSFSIWAQQNIQSELNQDLDVSELLEEGRRKFPDMFEKKERQDNVTNRKV